MERIPPAQYYHEVHQHFQETTQPGNTNTWQSLNNINEECESSSFALDQSSGLLGGKPAPKKRFNNVDILATVLSSLSSTVAITSVANESFSWYLGQGTNQLILLGVLLSVMSQCLAIITPTLFLLVEATYGASTLHNFDGILRNSIFATRFSASWRLALASMLAIPIGLSVAYKRFTGGSSTLAVNPLEFIGNDSYYGPLALPGLETIGLSTGITMFLNSTLDFAVRTSPTGGEPILPSFPHATATTS